MSYDPREYWDARAAANGATYVAKANALEHYDRELAEFEPHLRALVPPAVWTLDFGCGSGRFSELLGELAGGMYLGADISPEGLAIARQRHPERVYLDASDHRIDAEDGCYGCIVAVFVLQHMVAPEDFDRWCSEFRRLLAPGGSLVVIDRDPWPRGSPLPHMLPRGPEAIAVATGCRLAELRRVNVDHWAGRFGR